MAVLDHVDSLAVVAILVGFCRRLISRVPLGSGLLLLTSHLFECGVSVFDAPTDFALLNSIRADAVDCILSEGLPALSAIVRSCADRPKIASKLCLRFTRSAIPVAPIVRSQTFVRLITNFAEHQHGIVRSTSILWVLQILEGRPNSDLVMAKSMRETTVSIDIGMNFLYA
jgi:hypothetical protein